MVFRNRVMVAATAALLVVMSAGGFFLLLPCFTAGRVVRVAPDAVPKAKADDDRRPSDAAVEPTGAVAWDASRAAGRPAPVVITPSATGPTSPQRGLRRKLESGVPLVFKCDQDRACRMLGLDNGPPAQCPPADVFAVRRDRDGQLRTAHFFLATPVARSFHVDREKKTAAPIGPAKRLMLAEAERDRALDSIVSDAVSWARSAPDAPRAPADVAPCGNGAWNSITGGSTYTWNCVDGGRLDARVTLTVNCFKIEDGFADRDWYLVESSLHHEVNCTDPYQQSIPLIPFTTGYVGWFVRNREVKIARADSSRLEEYGPTGSISGQTATIGIGGGINTDPGAGIYAEYSRSYSIPDVTLTDQGSVASGYGKWLESLLCPQSTADYMTYPIWTVPAVTSKSSFVSRQAAIFRTSDLTGGVKVDVSPSAKICKDELYSLLVAWNIRRYAYNLNKTVRFTLRKNYAPDRPTEPSGPRTTWVNQAESYSTSGHDHDGDALKCRFDFGDRVGQPGGASQSHAWTQGGTYGVRVQAVDQPHGASSVWSPSFNVFVKSLSRLELEGASSVQEGSSTQLSCRAVFNDGTSQNCSPSYTIVSGSQYASIDPSGRLTAGSVDRDRDVTVQATYTDHGVSATDTMNVRITSRTPGSVRWSPTSADYGQLGIGGSKDQIFELVHAGQEAVNGSISASGEGFSIVSGGGSYTLSGGARRQVRVRFSPPRAGSFSGSLRASGGGSPSALLSGSGKAPGSVSWIPGSFDFGQVPVGSTRDRVFELANAGQEEVSGTISASGEGFSITGGGGSYTLAGGARRQVSVRFAPLRSGDFSGSLTASGGGSPAATLSGSGTVSNGDPEISQYFPETPFSMKAGRSQVFQIWATDPDGDQMTCSWKLDGKATGAGGETMEYSPTQADVGLHALEVTVTDTKGGSAKHTWSVSVTGDAGTPRLALSTDSISASCVQGSSPADASFKVRNVGGGELVYGVAGSAGWATCSPTSGDSAGEEDTITVKFSAAALAAGSHYTTITVTAAGAEASPQEVSVELTVTSSGNDGGGSGGGSSSKKSSKKDTKAGGGSGGGGGCCLAGGGSPLTDPAFLALPYALVLLMRRRRKRSGR